MDGGSVAGAAGPGTAAAGRAKGSEEDEAPSNATFPNSRLEVGDFVHFSLVAGNSSPAIRLLNVTE